MFFRKTRFAHEYYEDAKQRAGTRGVARRLAREPPAPRRARASKNKGFLEAMSRFLARQIATESQRSLVCEALGAADWPADGEFAAQLLYDWLSSDEASNASVTYILRRFSSPSGLDPAALCSVPFSGDRSPYYYGPEGKRQAVLRFLAAVNEAPAPQNLLLFSEEAMDWLFEDAVFAKKWASLLIAPLLRGNRVRIIHTVSRNVGEMLEAVSKWIPVYMTNMIEPYYCPKPRDGVFQRTLFLAPKRPRWFPRRSVRMCTACSTFLWRTAPHWLR